MKRSTIILIICVVVFVLFAVGLGSSIIKSYNKMIAAQEEVESTLSNLDVMLQRRADLIPNLVSTVKGYAKHEIEALDKVTEARTKLINANTVEEMSAANNQLTSSLKTLLLNVTENYPDLKASENFTNLTDELAGTENRIAVARRDYNAIVKSYNLLIKKFPNSILAGMFGFEKAIYFEADEASTEVPNVSFE